MRSALVVLVLVGCSARPAPRDSGPVDAGVSTSDAADDPRLAWVGTFDGTYEAVARDCTTGDVLDTDPPGPELRVIRLDADGLFVAFECPLRLTLTADPLSATIAPRTCEATLSDGTPLHVEYLRGTADLFADGNELWMETEIRLTYGDFCDHVFEQYTRGVRVAP